jgi:hypothetical protein
MNVPSINSNRYELERTYNEIINQIEALQEQQKHIKRNLGSGDDKTIEERIKKLVEERNNLYDRLKTIYNNSKDDLTRNRKVLKDQVAIVGILNNELERTKTNLEILESDKSNKLRLVEISNYESNRYKSYMNIMKYIIYASLLIIANYFIKERFGHVVPDKVFKLVIILIVGVAVILIGSSIFDLLKRDDRIFERYDFNRAYNPDMTAEKSNSYKESTKYSSGDNINWLNKGTDTNKEIIEGMMNYETKPDKAQGGSIVPGVQSLDNIESFMNY